ncbi:hypothetical protein [Actinacidiphila oryziradicis]|uniref:hypothetical protein n=1 Tax=Actinacidiphila oryziradicis TaxID=2571141 RepID=UPI00145E1002|nr:hypothetical protein [Actinacidiphila oryziradicis]
MPRHRFPLLIAALLPVLAGCGSHAPTSPQQNSAQSAAESPAAATAPTPDALQARALAAYADGYRMGGNLLSLGYASVPEGMDATAKSECSSGTSNPDVGASATADNDQALAWSAGCSDALEAKTANAAAAPVFTPPPYDGSDLVDQGPSPEINCGKPHQNQWEFGGNFTCRFTSLRNTDTAPHAYRITVVFTATDLPGGQKDVTRRVNVPTIPAGGTNGQSDPFAPPPETTIGSGDAKQDVQWMINTTTVELLPAGN